MTMLRAGLIGLGMMGRHHARVLSNLDGVELVAVADPGGDPFHVAGGREVLSGVDDIIAAGVDYCVVAVPTAFHEKVGLALAAAGIHTLIEKPLAESTESAQRLTDAFAARGLVGGVGHIERYNPALQEARRRIEAGELGDVYQVATRRQGPFPGRIADVGVVMDLATHDIDLTAWVTQQTYVEIGAQTARRSGRPFEDLVAVTGRMSGGAITNHLVNWLSPLKERVAVLTGEKGTLIANTLTADLTFYENATMKTEWRGLQQFRGVAEGNVTRYAIAKPEPLRVEHEKFRDAILGRSYEVVTMDEGADVVSVASRILHSQAPRAE